ncbi:hypothetical protein ACLB90_10910 [Stenotrophomonas sp. LGBM10]|uniref:hypothetical protein n=1 Tax=Stenotrophomonas sp. LGBM10 TaxID=3390038 RepID=UPI00398A9F45
MYISLLLAFLLLGSASEPGTPRAADALLADLVRLDTPDADLPALERIAAMQAVYRGGTAHLQTGADCHSIASDNQRDLFDATALMAFYQPDEALLHRMRCLHERLVSDGTAGAADHRALHGALVALRHFDEANQLRDRWSLPVPTLPDIRGEPSAGMEVLRLGHADAVERIAFPENGVHVVALVHPNCSFSARALQAIVTDPGYDALRGHMRLVVRSDPHWPEKAMRAWNTLHPDLPMLAMVPGVKFSQLDMHETPVFHLVQDGVVVETVVGWQGDGAAVRALAERLVSLIPDANREVD